MADRKSPVKVPVILQMEPLECGAASLAMVLAYYKKWVPLEQVRQTCGVSRDGNNALQIAEAAEQYGLKCRTASYNTEQLREESSFPMILLWKMTHFVVLCGFRDDTVYLNDPVEGRIRLSITEFQNAYSGICLFLEPSGAFVKDGRKASAFDFLKKGLIGNLKTVILVMITGALAVFAGTLIPVISRVYTDFILSGSTPSWYQGLLFLFGAVIFFQLITGVIHLIFIKKATGKLAVTANASFMHHILRMPMGFFAQRPAGDLSERAVSNDTVAATMIGRIASVFVNLVMLVFYLVLMLQYSVPLTIVGLITIAINLFLARMISNKRIEISRTQMRDKASLNAATVSGIDMIETIKASGAESGFLERWSGYHASMSNARSKFNALNRYIGTIPQFIQSLSQTAIMIMAYWSIMNNHFTAGMFLAFQACMTSFLTPVNDLIDSGQSIQEMLSSIERIHDVMEYPEDHNAKEDYSSEELHNVKKLSGRIEMKNVTFGYGSLKEPIIKDFSLSIVPGQRIAVVGESGCGKSTIARLLTGLYKPWSGEILFDGKPISEIPKPVFNGSLAMVDQEVVLFHDTIANNLRMWDETIEDFDLILAARDAEIHHDIIARKGGYNYTLEENGKDLSGGQRQRIEIARVLAGDPSIIILDEATSALDAQTEHDISNYIHDRGITCIIIAHRLSTIRDCNEIIVLEHGKMVQRGTHEELIGEEGLYRRLMDIE